MPIRIDDLTYFLAVVRAGQVRRAAIELGITQPAVTKGVARLEAELGFALFVRSPRGMQLTAIGEHLAARTGLLQRSLSEALKEAEQMHLGTLGWLRVGVSPLHSEHLFAPACVALRSQRPATRISVELGLNDRLFPALRNGDVELCISALPAVLPDDLAGEPLMRDDLWVVASENHPLARRRRLRLADLATAKWLLPRAEVAGRRAVRGRFAQAGLPDPDVAVEVSSSASVFGPMLRHGDLLSLMSESTLATLSGRGLVRLPSESARFERIVGLVVRDGVPLTPLAERFREIVREVVDKRTAGQRQGQSRPDRPGRQRRAPGA